MVIGNVQIGAKVFVGPNAVIRADEPCEVGEDCFIGFKSLVFKASLGCGVVIQHQAMVEGVTVPAGIHVPSMTVVLNQEDVRSLSPASPELATFAGKVRSTNTFLAEVSHI